MPAVFVHGVPDTHRMWGALLSQLRRDDVRTLSLPGFGTPRPAGFDARKESYVGWLLAELDAVPGPIDLVGHDWGAMLVLRAVSLRPARVRSFAAGGGPVDADYLWHDVARQWQTREVGEALMRALEGDALRAGLVAAGVDEAYAAEAARHVDAAMKDCILALYRSAIHVGREWAPDLARVDIPGLLLWGERDPYAAAEVGRRMAAATGARFVGYPGCGHWWPRQRPAEAAAELERFWSGLTA